MAENAIARREVQADALATIVGTGDTRAALAQVERNLKEIVRVARERGFVTTYDQAGQTREFYGLPAWQLLGMTYGVTAVIEWSRSIDNGYEARAVAKRLQNDQVVGSAEGMCTRTERGKREATEHSLRAMAESRAQRNALRRSPLGAVLVLAGYDFADPEAPATTEQVGLLHQLERELGLTHRQGHEEASVASYRDLTREQAAELIDGWTQRRDGAGEEKTSAGATGHPEAGVDTRAEAEASAGGPATEAQWDEAKKLYRGRVGIIREANKRYRVATADQITRGMLDELIQERRQ